MSRPTTFTPEIGERICELIASGLSVKKISRLPNMPKERAIFRWLASQDPDTLPGEENKVRPFDAFRQQYMRAREIRADARFERIDSIIHDMRMKKISYAEARVEIDAIKWQTGKENAKRYGDAMTLKGDKENPLQVQRTAVEMSEAELQAVAAGGLSAAT